MPSQMPGLRPARVCQWIMAPLYPKGLIERVIVRPAGDTAGLKIKLVGEITAMVRLGLVGNGPEQPRAAAADRDLFARSVKVVAGAGNHRQLTPIRGVTC